VGAQVDRPRGARVALCGGQVSGAVEYGWFAPSIRRTSLSEIEGGLATGRGQRA